MNANTSGNRTTAVKLGPFIDEGIHTYTAKATDEDGLFSDIIRRTVTVLNANPTITSLTEDLRVSTGSVFDFASTAIDPGLVDSM